MGVMTGSLFDMPAAKPTSPTAGARPAYAKPQPPTAGAGGKPMAAWVLRRLENAGYIDPNTGAARRARTVYCSTCRHAVMRGLTEPPMFPVDADPVPLTAEGEALAQLAGVRTYELQWVGNRYELNRRDQWRIKGRPAGITKFTDVLAEHRCGTHAAWPTADTMLADQLAAGHDADLPQDPPF